MINWQRVSELRDDVGAEDFDDVVALFLEEVAEVIARLTASPEPASLESELHFLKGSALNLGFDALGAICSEQERLAVNGQVNANDIAAVIEVYETSIAEFKSQLRRGRAA